MPAIGNVPELHRHMARESVHRERSRGLNRKKALELGQKSVCSTLTPDSHSHRTGTTDNHHHLPSLNLHDGFKVL